MPRRRPRPVGPPRWQRRAAARPEEILQAALSVFGAAGYAGARLADIARRAGLSKAALYLYFDSKAELFRESVRAQAAAALSPESAAAGFFPDTPEKQLLRFLRDTWAAFRRPELAGLIRLVHAEGARFPELVQWFHDEVLVRLQTRLAQVLEAGIARGVFRPVSHDFARHAIPSFLLHQALLRGPEAAGEPEALSDQAVVEGSFDLLLHGLLRRSTRSYAE